MTYHIVSSAASSVNRLSFMYHHNALCIIVYHHNTLLNQVTAMIAYHGLACPYLRLQHTDDMSWYCNEDRYELCDTMLKKISWYDINVCQEHDNTDKHQESDVLKCRFEKEDKSISGIVDQLFFPRSTIGIVIFTPRVTLIPNPIVEIGPRAKSWRAITVLIIRKLPCYEMRGHTGGKHPVVTDCLHDG